MGRPSCITTPEMMEGKMVKVPSAKIRQDINYNDLKPAFSFEYAQENYCLSKWDSKSIRKLIQELGKFEKHTWKEIYNDSLFQYSKVKKEGLRVVIPRFVTPDVDIYYMKPFGSGCKYRIFGIREGHNFKFLWFDNKHKVYPGGH